MSSTRCFSAACLIAAVAIWFTGCPGPAPGPTVATKSPPTKAEEGGHEHAHEHVHGPNGGHIIEIGMEEYHAEWTHSEDGNVTIYILDAEMKNEVPISAEEITIDTVVAGQANSFKLAAVNRSEGDMPKASKFEVVDKKLLGVLESLSEGVTATLKVTINDKAFEALIKHDDHGHKH